MQRKFGHRVSQSILCNLEMILVVRFILIADVSLTRFMLRYNRWENSNAMFAQSLKVFYIITK